MEKYCRSRQAATHDEMLFMATEDHTNGWLLDSGASSHITPFRADYISYRNISNPIAVTIADGACLNAVGVGDVKMVTIDGREITVTEVLFIPNLDRRLISIPTLTSRGLDVMFGHRSCDIMKNDKLWVSVPRRGDSYYLPCRTTERANFVEHTRGQSELELWHARLGYTHLANYRRLQLINPELPVEEVHDNQDVGENRQNMRDQVDDGHSKDESVSANFGSEVDPTDEGSVADATEVGEDSYAPKVSSRRGGCLTPRSSLLLQSEEKGIAKPVDALDAAQIIENAQAGIHQGAAEEQEALEPEIREDELQLLRDDENTQGALEAEDGGQDDKDNVAQQATASSCPEL
ncbi:hypothetical protein PsorP6_017770 [Peronosclerospora sorghi]|uniref:Uncharacterized protein n=1 Tax=Peronosclerospora sorghi TaxID=230839 RepID=A0ACC0WNN1_9STRA|nr:hypothetical protein PsorP6_017770 [Peronosclerospora sorghi]